MAFVAGSESAQEKTIKLGNSLRAWDDALPKNQGMYYHYTSVAVARLIGQTGFRVSDFGMEGRGVYFSTLSPVDPSFTAHWPEQAWKEQILRANYADAWQVRVHAPS